jgi:cytochrome c5
VSAAHDKKFFDTFMLVLGILVVVTVGLFVLSRNVAARTQELQVLGDPFVMAAVSERIQPVRKLAVAGKDNSALAPLQPAGGSAGEGASTAAAGTSGKEMSGEDVFAAACVVCHGSGVAGAPRWATQRHGRHASRRAKPCCTNMRCRATRARPASCPPRVGRADLTDQSVIAAVDHMVTNSK